MTQVKEKFESVISDISQEILEIEEMPRQFEHLRYTQIKSFEELEYKRVYMVNRGIYKIDNIADYNKLSLEERCDFMFEDGNWPKFNECYIKEATKESYADVLINVSSSIKLKKIEFCSKVQYYQYDDFRNFIREQLDYYNQKLLSERGQKYLGQHSNYFPQIIFNSKLDVFSSEAISYTNDYVDGRDNLYTPEYHREVSYEYGYPALYFNKVLWAEFEMSVRMIEVLESLLLVKKTEKPTKTIKLVLNEKILLMDKLGLLTHLEDENLIKSDSKKAKLLSILFTSSEQNTREFLGMLKKSPKDLGDKFKDYDERIDKLLREL